MQISYQWLKKYLSQLPCPEKVAQLLTQLGLEVNALTTFQFFSPQLIIGQIRTCQQHPHADKLKKTTVDIGKESPLHIICGAPNVAVGQKVIVAPIGTILKLPHDKTLKIEKIKIRGEISEGMLCSEEEIGLPTTQEGILVIKSKQKPGTPAHTYFSTSPDTIFHIDLTPNRADAFSHIGIARELSIILQKELQEPIIEPLVPAADMLCLQTIIQDPIACPRYTSVVLKNIQIRPSPLWLQNKLQAIGIKTINNVVDITNFIMYELGQPIHAFDYDQLASKKITIKKLPPRTPFTALDNITRTLTGHELMLCDKTGPLSMAGIIGGIRAKITPKTTTVLLESAYFDPVTIAQAVRHHHLHTEAAFRFERGTDPTLTHKALQRAANLLKKITQTTIACDILDYYPTEIPPTHITISYAYINKLIGTTLSPHLIHNLLTQLDIKIQQTTQKNFTALVPPYRVDVKRPADLVEEILRLYGYNNLPNQQALPHHYTTPPSPHEIQFKHQQKLTQLLAHQGYHQIITNPITKSKYPQLPKKNLYLQNPLNQDLDTLRQTLLFSGLEVIAHNLKHNQTNLKLFEIGKTYHKEQEQNKLAIWLTGYLEPPNWIRKPKQATIYDLYATIHLILHHNKLTQWQTTPLAHSFYKQCITLKHQSKIYLHMGTIHPTILNIMDIHHEVLFAEINLQQLLQSYKNNNLYTPIAKNPSITRDISLELDQNITFEQIRHLIQQQNLPQLQNLYLLDCYTGSKLPNQKKSYTLRLIWQDAYATLRDEHANTLVEKIMQKLSTQLTAVMR